MVKKVYMSKDEGVDLEAAAVKASFALCEIAKAGNFENFTQFAIRYMPAMSFIEFSCELKNDYKLYDDTVEYLNNILKKGG